MIPYKNIAYYGARYLDPKTSRWISADPAMGDYIPGAPINDEVRKRNGNLPGMGGVFNVVNLHTYHYAGNNPVKYTDPDGETPVLALIIAAIAVSVLLQSDSSNSPSPVVNPTPDTMKTIKDTAVNFAKHEALGAGLEATADLLNEIGHSGAGGVARGVGAGAAGIAIVSDAINLMDVINDPSSTMPDYADAISDLAISGIGAAGLGGAVLSTELSIAKKGVVETGKAVADFNAKPMQYANKMSEWATGFNFFDY